MTQGHIFYSGTVQGVGFRYTVQRFANQLNVTGWAKNLTDGGVEILVEGPKDSIEQLINSIDKYFEGYIQEKEVSYEEFQGDLKLFQIAY